MARKVQISSEEKVALLIDALEDRKAIDIVKIDLQDKGVMVADYFVVCTGTSTTHIRAIAERVLERADERHLLRPSVEGEAVAEWVLLDFGDVVVHVMAEEPRARYRLEEFWTTPQPKGALPPRPGATGPADDAGDEVDVDTFDLDEDDEGDLTFFTEADREVEPIDEDD